MRDFPRIVVNFLIQLFSVILANQFPNADPANAATVSGGGTYSFGSSATISMSPNIEYVLHHWTYNGSIVSTKQSFTKIINET